MPTRPIAGRRGATAGVVAGDARGLGRPRDAGAVSRQSQRLGSAIAGTLRSRDAAGRFLPSTGGQIMNTRTIAIIALIIAVIVLLVLLT